MDSIFCNVNNWEGALCKSLIIVEIHAEDEAPSGARPLTFCLRAWCTLPLTHEASAIRLTSVVAEDTSLLSPDAPISELASTVRTDDVFRDPYCGITTGMVKAMGILCRCVGETLPQRIRAVWGLVRHNYSPMEGKYRSICPQSLVCGWLISVWPPVRRWLDQAWGEPAHRVIPPGRELQWEIWIRGTPGPRAWRNPLLEVSLVEDRDVWG